jgi:2-polyprenyl-6-methoxyphenol hydroxylase-like FAD-dependent oxidoreductase
LVGTEHIAFGSEVVSYSVDAEGVSVEVSGPNGTQTVRGFMVLGADGIGSTVRKILRGKAERPRYAGEVCHRGVIDLSRTPARSPLRSILESPEGEMKLIYGKGWRGSYGMIGKDQGYWWFKHTLASSSVEGMDQSLPSEEVTASWPEPFAVLVRGTDEAGYYVEPVLDRTEAWDWGGDLGRVICAGDAAHPVTPNMAQGKVITSVRLTLS